MSGEFARPTQNPRDPSATASWSSNGNALSEESPELLRWRADTLLDEMMLGAVDISASDGISSPEHAAVDSTHHQAFKPKQPYPIPTDPYFDQSYVDLSPSTGHSQGIQATRSPQTAQQDETVMEDIGYPPRSAPPHSTQEVSTYNGRPEPRDLRANSSNTRQEALLHRPSAVESAEQYPSPFTQPDLPSPMSTPPATQNVHSPVDTNRHQTAPASEQPWQPASRPTGYSPAYQTGYNTRADERPTWSVASGTSNDYLTSVPRNTESNHSSRERSSPQTYQETYQIGVPYSDGNQIHADRVPTLGPVASSRSNMPFADAMTVGPQARRVSPLLPRQSQFDFQTLQQEMASLEEDIHVRMPAGQPTTERALHLLEKGRTILHSDPDRSAEVSYYVQQVKAILERSAQRYQWSGLYRNRLSTYLGAWLVFSLIALTARSLYSAQMNAFLQNTFDLITNGLVMQHWLALASAFFAGTLGGAIGALFNMWRHSRKQHGFFDRKYGMLGLVLPLIGATVGLLLYLVLGAGYVMFNINPATSLLASTIPAALALLFGLYQEHIYGTAE